jgi:hypothetical protein
MSVGHRFAPSAKNSLWAIKSGVNVNMTLSASTTRFPVEVDGTEMLCCLFSPTPSLTTHGDVESTHATPVFELFTTANVRLGVGAADIDHMDGRRELHLYYTNIPGALHSTVRHRGDCATWF